MQTLLTGFKFDEIRTWLLSGRLDSLVILETKIDGSFPDSKFQVKGGWGLLIYARSVIYFVKVKHLKEITLRL